MVEVDEKQARKILNMLFTTEYATIVSHIESRLKKEKMDYKKEVNDTVNEMLNIVNKKHNGVVFLAFETLFVEIVDDMFGKNIDKLQKMFDEGTDYIM